MGIQTYDGLKSAVADWVARADLAEQIPDFITLAEVTFNYGDMENEFEPLRTREMETKDILLLSGDGSSTLPEDYLDMIRVTSRTAPGRVLEYAPSEWTQAAYPSGDGGTPHFYTILGEDLYCGADVDIVYHARIPSLADHNQSNWLLFNYPNIYLFTSLYYLSVFIKDPEMAQAYRGMAKGIMNGIQKSSRADKAGSYARRSAVPAW